MNRKLHIAFPLLIALSMITGMSIGFKLKEDTNTIHSFFHNDAPTSMSEIVQIVEKNYVDSVNVNELKKDAVNAFLSKLDPYSIYLPPFDAQVFQEEMQGNFKGIGIDYEKINDTIHILSLTTNGPAEKGGIQVGDHLTKLNGIDITFQQGKGVDFRKTLRDEIKKSNDLKFTVSRNGKIIEVPVTAGTVPLPSIEVYYMLTPSIGYVKMNKFSETSYKEFMEYTEDLQKKGMKHLVVDLRGNSGGIMEQAYQIAAEFFPANQLIFSTKGRNDKKDFLALRDGFYINMPLVLLVDETTASSSEIFAGTMQDYDRAIIIGRQTFGKDLVQKLYRLKNGGAIRLSSARYYTPLGRDIQKPFENIEIPTFKIKTFKTKSGKILHSYQAIQPDITIPFDSAGFPKEIREFYLKGVLSRYAYSYYITHANMLKQYTSPIQLAEKFNPTQKDWEDIVHFAKTQQYNISDITPNAKNEVLKKFKAFLARQIWRNQGYFIASNYADANVKKAIEVLSQKKN